MILKNNYQFINICWDNRSQKNNQIFYKTYFKLRFDVTSQITYFDKELAKLFYHDKYINYHCEFFKAGITAIIKMWLDNNCKETSEEKVTFPHRNIYAPKVSEYL